MFLKSDYLDIKFAPNSAILPYKNNEDNVMTVPVQWTPRTVGPFNEQIEFLVNGKHK